MIATTGRSGSTLLCSRISEYGILGFPNEFLNESYIAEFDRLFPEPSLSDFENFVLHSFCSTEGAFGIKTDYWRFQQSLQSGLLDSLYSPLDLIVFLGREDLVSQAVSLALAVESNIWHGQNLSPELVDERQVNLRYSSEKIKSHARNILDQEYYWRNYFATCSCPVLEMSYEAVASQLDDAVKTIAGRLGYSIEPLTSKPIIERRKSSTGTMWIKRFTDECEDFIDFWAEYRGCISAE